MKRVRDVIIVIMLLWPAITVASDIVISTGDKQSVFYPVGKTLCQIFNTHQSRYSCRSVESKGAAVNLQDVLDGKVTFAMSQSGVQGDAYEEDDRLRSVFQLHMESLAIIVKNDSGIRKLSDLFGKRVNIGNNTSSGGGVFAKIMQLQDWNKSDFKEVYEEGDSKATDLFCQNKIDAAIYLRGHPNNYFMRMIEDCGGRLIGLSQKEQERFQSISKDLTNSLILSGTYMDQEDDVMTIGIKTILSTSEESDPDLLYSFVKVIYDNREELVEFNQVFREVNLRMSNTSNIAPLADAVDLYFSEN